MEPLREVLNEYCTNTMTGIQQHTEEWHNAKRFTIGGSLMAVIQGVSPYNTREQLLADKTIGAGARVTSLAMNWGTLFEDILRGYIERDMGTEIVADNSFIYGPPGTHTSYSPDGIGVVEAARMAKYDIAPDALCANVIMHQDMPPLPAPPPGLRREQHIVLFEFKCLFSRIPGASPPEYYVPQVKTGLDIIPVTDYGVLIESVFRRCPFADMGNNVKFDKTLAPRKYGKGVLAMGIIGFMHDPAAFAEKLAALRSAGFGEHAVKLARLRALLKRQFAAEYGPADVAASASVTEGYDVIDGDADTTDTDLAADDTAAIPGRTYDLATASRKLTTTLFECAVLGIIDPWYGETIIDTNDVSAKRKLGESLATFQFMVDGAETPRINFGFMPWKLFGIRIHPIHRTQRYIAQWQHEIDHVINTARAYHELPESERAGFLNQNICTETQYTIIDGSSDRS